MAVNPEEYTYLWKDRIVSHPEILGGKPIVKGTRLSVEFVTDRLYRREFHCGRVRRRVPPRYSGRCLHRLGIRCHRGQAE